jgi:adenine-specific DNA-methyltransferase
MHTISSMSIATPSFDLIQNHIGSPIYENDNVMLYHGDCLSFMQKLPPSILDLTVTSPPYNIGKEYEDVIDMEDYIDWCGQWMREIHRLTSPTGSFWLNLGYLEIKKKAKAIPIPYLLWDKSDFFFMQEVVWNYGAGVACKHLFSPRNEKFLWYVKDESNYCFNLDEIRDKDVKYPNQKKNGKLRCNPLGKNPSDVWQFPKVTSGKDRSSSERTPHPAQFPIAVIDRIIKCSSAPQNIVMDPFMGSGTTAEVALKNNRKVIGFEKNIKYIEISIDRIERLFEKESLAAKQPSLFEAAV